MKNKKYHNFGTNTKSNIKMVERGIIGTLNTQIHIRSEFITNMYCSSKKI